MKFAGFRIEYRVQHRASGLHYHARVLAERNGKWDVCGLLTVDAPEWRRLATLFETSGLEVIPGEELSADEPENTPV